MAENTESSSLSTSKLPLPSFLKVFTSGGISMGDAMALTKKIYPNHNSPSRLAELTPLKLTELKVDNKDQRKAILAAVRKAGYVKKASKPGASDGASTSGVQDAPVASSSSTSQRTKANLPRKRKRDDDLNEPLPDSTTPEGSEYGNFDFNEILDEKVLKSKSTLVNRAPVMTAWATVVAEAMGFNREEALSIASVYTEMNASSKGVSLGIFSETKHKDYVAGSSQPFVEFMGRTPVMKNEKDEWRAIVKGSPVEPGIPFGYMKRVFRQTLPAVIGAMRLLVQSIESNELNAKGYGLYADFRPENSGWGKKSEMKMTSILALRTAQTSSAPNDGDDDIQASSQELTESAIEASQAERTSTPYRVQLGEGPKEPKRLKLGTEDA